MARCYLDSFVRRMWHQKLDNPTDKNGIHDQCSYFPYVGGYAVATTPGLDGTNEIRLLFAFRFRFLPVFRDRPQTKVGKLVEIQ